MMNNLFSTFDPSSSILSLSWMILFAMLLMTPLMMWNTASPTYKMINSSVLIFKTEVKFALNKTEKSVETMIMTMFLMILLMNFLALYPQIFSPTSHMTITLPLSLITWLTIMLYGWLNNTNHMLAHLLPQGTPGALMMFMVLIEMTSNIIRPITLCVRLTANLIAGHLLMTLLGNTLITMSGTQLVPTFIIPILLTILESAVACIQAYVFVTLITLYTTEIK